jgi:hypothetical protein
MTRAQTALTMMLAGLVTTAPARSAPPLREVTITARDYAFSVPASLPAGLTAFHFVNRGKVPHEVQFFRFNLGLSLKAAREYLADGFVPDSVADRSGSVLTHHPAIASGRRFSSGSDRASATRSSVSSALRPGSLATPSSAWWG